VLSTYRDTSESVRQSHPPELPADVVWMDLLDPTADETASVEDRAGVPSRARTR